MPAVLPRDNRVHLTAAKAGLILALLPGLWPTSAQADDPRLAPVEIVGPRHSNAVGDWDAASQGEAAGTELAARALLRPGEVLEAVPGLIVTQHSGDGKANQYFLRGYNLDHGTDFATWVAGMPVNMPSHAHGQGYTDLNFVIPELIQRIGWRKGPYFADDGDFASAGSARIDYTSSLSRSIASITAGSFGYRRALLAGSPVLGAGRFLYALEMQGDDGPWQVPEHLRKFNAVLRYSLGSAANGFSVTAMSYSARWTATDQLPRRALDAGGVDRFGSPDASDGGTQARDSVSVQWRQADGAVSRQANAYAIRSRLALWSNFTYRLNRPDAGDQFEQAEARTVLGGAASQSWFEHWGERHVFTTIGVQARRDRLAPVGLYDSIARRRTATVREDAVSVESIAPYVSNTVEWSDAFRTIAGLRADHQRTGVASNLAANSGAASASIVSPKLSLVFGPWSRTEYFLNWGHGFHSNDARGATLTVDPRTLAPTARVSPLAKTRGSEFGLRSQAIEHLNVSVTLWHLTQASELVFAGDAGTTQASRASHRNGLEWIGTWTPARWLALDTNLALTRARFDDGQPSARFVPGAPSRVASAGVTVNDAGRWSGSLRWRHFGARPLTEDGALRSASTSIVNARVAFAFSPDTKFTLDLLNLLNRKADDISYAYTSRLGGEPAAGVNDVHLHPVEPRALRLSVTIAY